MLLQRPFKLFGIEIRHEPAVIFNLEKIFNELGPFDWVIELGTGNGGLAIFFSVQQRIRGGKFVTFDFDLEGKTGKNPRGVQVDRLKRLSISYQEKDIFSPRTRGSILRRIKEGKTFLYCDNGNKATEFRTFAPHLKPGSVVGVDDWGTEIREEHVSEICKRQGLRPIKQWIVGARQRFWLKDPADPVGREGR